MRGRSLRGRSLRQAALMIGGSLILVQMLVTVLESQARPAGIDPAFMAELQKAQHDSGSFYATLPRRN